jgi:uncharacterized lipoprotein YajG|tara:strand:+ start:463 stop:765 length:303 start_codon:yes stop_codon:yes gene_type:complete
MSGSLGNFKESKSELSPSPHAQNASSNMLNNADLIIAVVDNDQESSRSKAGIRKRNQAVSTNRRQDLSVQFDEDLPYEVKHKGYKTKQMSDRKTPELPPN